MPTTEQAKRFGSILGVLVCAALAGACDGGGGSLGPLWVETDVIVADVDGDGRADVLTLAMMSDGGYREGHLLVYRQAAPGAFAAPTTTIVGAYPWRLALGDIDRDGRQDAVVADSGTIWVLMQDAARPGAFLTPQVVASGGNSVVIADLDGDGALDVAASGGSSAVNAIVVRYQDRAVRGAFGPPVTIAVPGAVWGLTAGDVDGDGLTDLLAAVYTDTGGIHEPIAGGLVVLFQRPGDGFIASDVLAPQTGLNTERLAIADANRDGRPDLLASLSPSSQDYPARLVVVPQTAARGFGAPVYTSLAGLWGNLDAVFADLNGDGVVDAALAGFWPESGGPLAAPNVRSRANLLLNNGSGAFALSAQVEMPVAVSRLTAGDVDGDGRNDIVLYGDAQCLVMLQSAMAGSFLAPRVLR